MIEINSERLNKILSTTKIVFVDFKTDWCQPCKYLSQQLDILVDKYSDKVTFVKIDVENEPELGNKYEIRSVPTVIIFKNGEIISKLIGMRQNSEFEEQIKILLDE